MFLWELLAKLGLGPSATLLRRHSADVAAVFLRGLSAQRIADELGTHVALIEDAIRFEMKRREKRRARG